MDRQPQRRGSPATATETAPAEPRAATPAPTEVVLALQRSAGNQAVGAMLAREPDGATLSPVPEREAQMDADVNFIASKLQEQILTSSEEQSIVDLVRKWADVDTDAIIRGEHSAGALDRFIFKLKVRVVTRSTARSAFLFDTSVNVFDTLFHELEDGRLTEFQGLLVRSDKYASAGPESEPSENVWATVGHQELIGLFGMMKGLSTGLAGVGDVAVWAALKQANMYLLPFGQEIKDPGKMADWIGKQLDISGDAIFDNQFTQGEELFLGQNAASIGTAGGSVIWNLVMLHGGSGAGSAGAGMLPQGMKALDLVSKFKGVDDALTSMGDYLLRMQEKRQLTREHLLADDEFKIECFKLAGAVVGAIGGALGATGDTAKMVQVAMEKLALVFKGGEIGAKLGEISQILMDDTLQPAAQRAAVGKLVMELVSDAFSIVGEKAAGADKATAEARSAQMQFNERTLEVIPALPLETDPGASQEGRSQPGVDDFGMLDLDVVEGPPLELDTGASQDPAAQADDYGMVDLPEAEPELAAPVGGDERTRSGGGGGGGGGGPTAPGAVPYGHVETATDMRAARRLYMKWVTDDPSREVEIMTHADGRVFVIQGRPGEGVEKWRVAQQLGVNQKDLSSERHFHNAYDPASPDKAVSDIGKSGYGPSAVRVPSMEDLRIFASTARTAGKPYRSEINYLLPDGSLGQTTILVTPGAGSDATYAFWVRRGPTKGLRATFATPEAARYYLVQILTGTQHTPDATMPAVPPKR